MPVPIQGEAELSGLEVLAILSRPAVLLWTNRESRTRRSALMWQFSSATSPPDDVLSINVWKEPEISRTVPVRSDGKISLPLVGQVQASGETPHQLEKDLATKLQRFIFEPEVTVIVTEVKGQKFNIPGQVSRPGSYPLPNSPTVPPGTEMPLLLPWRSLHNFTVEFPTCSGKQLASRKDDTSQITGLYRVESAIFA